MRPNVLIQFGFAQKSLATSIALEQRFIYFQNIFSAVSVCAFVFGDVLFQIGVAWKMLITIFASDAISQFVFEQYV